MKEDGIAFGGIEVCRLHHPAVQLEPRTGRNLDEPGGSAPEPCHCRAQPLVLHQRPGDLVVGEADQIDYRRALE
jgi:hypothetical protein